MDALIEIFSYKAWVVTDLLRYLFLWLDGMIYGLIQPIYSIAIKLSNLRNFFTAEDIASTTAKNIYVFLALFMLFKLAFSVISMIANPDLAADKQKGLGKVFSNAVITIILVVIMPTVFNVAYGVQDILINEGVLSGIFTNVGGKSDGITENEGEKISKNVFKVFIGKNTKITHEDAEVNNALNNFDTEGISALYHKDAIKSSYDNQYRIYYMMLISTVVGAIMLITFIKMCIEIALRSIKLIVIEVISPIAIISYLDPQSASKGIFSKWSGLAIKTYLSLFIRLGTLYFLTALLASIDYKKFGSLSEAGFGVFELLFVVLAIIAFMQLAPKFLEEMFGYKPGDDGKAIKGIVNGALGFGVGAAAGALGVAGQAGGALTGAIGKKIFGDKPPGNFRKFLHGANSARKAGTGAIGDVLKGGLSGAKAGAKDGAMAARNTPKDMNYKKAAEAKEKAFNERWQKTREADDITKQGKPKFEKMEKAKNNQTAIKDYANNPDNFKASSDSDASTKANAEVYKSLYNKTERQKEFAEAIGQAKQKSKFNNATFSAPIAQRKDMIEEAKARLGVFEDQKIEKQSELDVILSGGHVVENGVDVTYETAVNRVVTLNNQITSTNTVIEKTKGELETLFKDPNYARDAKIEAGMKQYGAGTYEKKK